METKKHDLDQSKQQLLDYIKQDNKEGVMAFIWLVIITLIAAAAITLLVLNASGIDAVSTLI